MRGVAPLFLEGGDLPHASNRPHDHGLHQLHANYFGKKKKTGRQEWYTKGGCNHSCVKSKISDEIFSSLPFLMERQPPLRPPLPDDWAVWHNLKIRIVSYPMEITFRIFLARPL